MKDDSECVRAFVFSSTLRLSFHLEKFLMIMAKTFNDRCQYLFFFASVATHMDDDYEINQQKIVKCQLAKIGNLSLISESHQI